MSLPRSFDPSRNKTEHPRGWETKNPSRSPFLCSPEITKMRKIIYYGISSDASFLPSPFLPKFLELLHNTFDTLAAYGASG